MKLEATQGILYLNNMQFCYIGPANGRTDLPTGSFTVEARFSHAHGDDMVHADGFGWVGATRGCDAVLGRIRTNAGVDPCQLTAGRLLAAVETAGDRGERTTLVIS